MEQLSLRDVMTPTPRFVQADDTLQVVQELFDEHGFRHLPVLMGDLIVGVVSDRDVTLAFSLATPETEASELRVSDICTPNPYTVDVEESFDQVLQHMGDTKIGSAIVTESDKMIGILTTTDICKVCGKFLKELFSEHE